MTDAISTHCILFFHVILAKAGPESKAQPIQSNVNALWIRRRAGGDHVGDDGIGRFATEQAAICLLNLQPASCPPSVPATSYSVNLMPLHFPYHFDDRWRLLFVALGVRATDGVTVTESELIATYGRFKVKTPLDNIEQTDITGPHRWYTAVGLRLSFTDDGVTFGTNHWKGLSIAFKQEIPKVVGFRDHSLLWVSVADPEGLAAAIGK